MKRLAIILSVVFLFIVCIFIFSKPVIIGLAKKQLALVFVQSRVSIGGCVFKPLRALSLSDIEIKRNNAYDIKVKEASIQYNLFALLRGGSLKLSLNNARVYLNTPQKGIREFAGYLKLRKGRSPIGPVEVSDLGLDINALDLTLKAEVSLGLDLVRQAPDYLDVTINIFKMFGAEVDNGTLKIERGSGQGNLSITKIKYDKLNITDIKGEAKLEEKKLLLNNVSAKALDGDMEGDMNLLLGPEVQYLVNLKCTNLDVEKFVQDFNLAEKFEMTGRISGEVKLRGKGERVEILSGSFSALEPGGKLVITDTKFLENMARDTSQPMNLLVESFKNYLYNKGLMSLGLEGKDLVLKVGLEGEAGKRSLNVIIHDIGFGEE